MPSPRPQSRTPRKPNWIRLSDANLLKLRICDLSIGLPAHIQRAINLLHKELHGAGLPFLQPRVYLGTDWFSPEKALLISVPFYLAHPRLKKLERKLMQVVEGGSFDWCLRILRHEAGHCFDHAYGLSKSSAWKELFGSSRRAYNVDEYYYDRSSKDFVKHLEPCYSQAHPDEDFAETFAVWLTPNSGWRKKHKKDSLAYKKLCYVDAMVAKYGHTKPFINTGRRMASANNSRTTLERFYKLRKVSHLN